MADREKLIELLKKNVYLQAPSIADYLLSNGVVVREEGVQEYFVETSFDGEVTEVYDFGWRCSHCKKSFEEMIGGYWDDETEMPTVHFCPNCGADMRGII